MVAVVMQVAGRPDPYRALFEQLAAGAARCRVVVEPGQALAVEVIEENAAFAPFRAVIAPLHEAIGRVRATGAAETATLRLEAATLSVTVVPTTSDEVMVVVTDVSDRERLVERSQASENRFEQAFHGNAAAMVIAHQSDLRIIDVNPRWLELFGATRDQVIGRTSTELGLISAEAARARIAQHKRFVDGYESELELRTVAGGRVTVLASAKPIQIEEGVCTLTTLIDITARKHAEEAFAVAFNASPAGMLLVEATTDRVVSVNQRMLDMTGRTREELVGRTVSEVAFVKTPARSELLAQIERTGRLEAAEIQLETKDGAGVWTLASAEVITLQDKVHRLSVFTDIRGRKLFERRLLTQHAIGHILAQSSELETAVPPVIEALCIGEGWECGAMWLPDDTGDLRCRGTWHRLGDPHALETIVRATVAGRSQNVIGRVLATGTPERFELDPSGAMSAVALAAGMSTALVLPILRGTEVLGVVALAGTNPATALDAAELGIVDSVGRMLGLFVERARAEASLRELNAELERRVTERTQALETMNRELEAFTSTVSHDLRAPLRTISGFSAILLEDFAADLPAEAQRLLGSIREGGDRLRNLIEDLLAFSHLGRSALRRRRIDVEPLVRSVLDELLAGRNLGERLELRVHPLGTCEADPSLLRAVWTNLLDNALKYARDRPVIEIEIGTEIRDGETHYYVRDNGVGFDMAQAGRLFGVFQRLHSSREFEGTGVGLANVRRIVERHHGRITARAEVGRGATFEFTLGGAPG